MNWYKVNKGVIMQKYSKLIVAGVAGLIAVLNVMLGNGNEAVAIVVAVAGAFGVYQVENK